MQALANSYWFWLLLVAVLGVVYFLPTVIGLCRCVEHLAPVVVLNAVGGVTGVGWLGALILAFGPKRQEPERAWSLEPEPEYYPVLTAGQAWREAPYG
jgi:T4 superinfection immunity protein